MQKVIVTWVDAETIGDSSWQNIEDLSDDILKPPPLMQTMGFMLGDFPTHLALTDSLGDKECGHLTKIPKEMIKEIEYV